MKVVGLYKTREAAEKARAMIHERGVASEQVSLLAPDRGDGERLGAYSGHKMAETAWIGGAIGGAIGAFVFGLIASGEVAIPSIYVLASGHSVGAIFGAALGFAPAALIGALVGLRRRQLKAGFFEADARRGAVALGVRANDAEELEAVRYAFRATGALAVQGRLAAGTSGDADPDDAGAENAAQG